MSQVIVLSSQIDSHQGPGELDPTQAKGPLQKADDQLCRRRRRLPPGR